MLHRLYAGGGALEMGGDSLPGAQLLIAALLLASAVVVRMTFVRRQPWLFTPIVRTILGRSALGQDTPARWHLYVGMGLCSTSVMLTELLITRLFSVVLHYHFAFMAISLALLGLGFSGIVTYLFARRLARRALHVWVPWLAILAAISTALAAITILNAEVSPRYSPENFHNLLRIYLVVFIPLFLSGMIITLLLSRRSEVAGRLYFADLIGAALAGPILVPLTSLLGAPALIVVAAAIVAVSGAVIARAGRYRRGVWACSLVAVFMALAAIVGPASTDLFSVRFAKGRKQASVLFTQWNSFSRVAVYDRNHETWGLSPRYRGELPPARWLDIDASASTPITKATGPLDQMPHFQWVLTAYGYKLRVGGEAIVIGAGGGRDVLSALNHGFTRVDGVELNPIIVDDVMRGEFRDYSGRLYDDPRVHIHVDDGRSFVRRSQRQVDVIQLSLVDTWATTSAGAYMLSENNLYTVEAIGDYLDHLNHDGILSIARWPAGSLRTLSLFVEARKGIGHGDPANCAIVLGHGNLIQMLLKKQPFTPSEIATTVQLARKQGFKVYYAPQSSAHTQRVNDFWRLLTDPTAYLARSKKDLSPVTDDRPFFFNFTRLRDVANPFADGRLLFGDGLGNLLSVLCITAGMGVVCFVLPMGVWLVRRRRHPPSPAAKVGSVGGRMLLYFCCLGFGFIVIEIVLIQKLTLLLGHPTTSLVVSLCGILAGGGVGAWFTVRRDERKAVLHARIATATVLVLVLVATFGLHTLVSSVISASLVPRGAVAFALVFGVGFVLGIPLPLGIRILNRHPLDRELISWAWGLNGALSVFGSGAAVFLAMFFGFSNTMLVGAGGYALALIVMLTLSDSPHRPQATPPESEA